jgi:transposase InsO family protein
MSGAARAFLASASPGTSRAEIAKKFGCSRSSLYYKPKQPAKDEELRARIASVMSENPAYGYRRVALALELYPNTVHRVMKRFHMQPRIQRKRRKPRTNTGESLAPTPNLMKIMSPIVPNFMWAGDFTEFYISHGKKIYLATVIDVFTRQIIGWSIGRHHTAGLVIEALEDAFRHRGMTPAVFHSDQGSEYTSNECIFWLVSHNIRPSWSPKAKPWNNGKKESFYSQFKLELGETNRIGNTPDFYDAVNKQIHYYNHKRIHGIIRMIPEAFFQKHRHRAQHSVPWNACHLPN